MAFVEGKDVNSIVAFGEDDNGGAGQPEFEAGVALDHAGRPRDLGEQSQFLAESYPGLDHHVV